MTTKEHASRSCRSGGSSRGRVRLRGVLVAAVCVSALCALWRLSPRRDGYGTHTQMGLSGCSFLARTGYPCPGCGLTTSLSAMAQGRWVLAWKANLFGVLLFVAMIGFALLGMIEACTGWNVIRWTRPGTWWAWLVAAGLLLGWGVKVGLGIMNGTYPLWS